MKRRRLARLLANPFTSFRVFPNSSVFFSIVLCQAFLRRLSFLGALGIPFHYTISVVSFGFLRPCWIQRHFLSFFWVSFGFWLFCAIIHLAVVADSVWRRFIIGALSSWRLAPGNCNSNLSTTVAAGGVCVSNTHRRWVRSIRCHLWAVPPTSRIFRTLLSAQYVEPRTQLGLSASRSPRCWQRDKQLLLQRIQYNYQVIYSNENYIVTDIAVITYELSTTRDGYKQ